MNKVQKKLLEWVGLGYLVDATNWKDRYRRPFEPQTTNTIAQEVNQYDWYQLLSDSRKLYCNLGPVTGAIDDKATYSVGRAWNAKFCGEDKEWGAKAERWLNEEWYPMADARGTMFDFKTDLFLQSVSVDRDGEIYIYLTESPEGWPQIQLLPAHMIGDSDNSEPYVSSGPYKGMRLIQGVVSNDVGRAVAYHVLGPTKEQDSFISARDLIQVFDPRWADQVRGFPVFMHALLDLKDLRQIQGYEKIAAELMSSIGILEWNETGAPDLDPANILKGTTFVGPQPVPGVTIEQIPGGGNIKYMRGNSGSKIEQLKNDRPSVQLDEFMNRLIRNACVGAGWPYELTWDASKLGGANVRLLIAKAMRAVEDRQDLLRPVAKRCVGYAVAKAIKSGLLEPSDEWYKWRFTMPARMTADYGRDAKADLADYQAGLKSMTDILGEEGIDLDDHIDTLEDEREKLTEAGLPVAGIAATPTPTPEEIAAQKAEQDKADQQTEDETASEMAALERRHTETITALKSQVPASITIHQPEITIHPAQAPVIHLGKNEVTVQPAQVTVPAPIVTMAAPVVNVHPSTIPAPVVNVQLPKPGKRMFIKDAGGKTVGIGEE